MKIRLCEHNQGAEKLAKQLEEEFAGLNIKIKKCAKQCKVCRQAPFAIANKHLIKASDSGELLLFLKQLIEQEN